MGFKIEEIELTNDTIIKPGKITVIVGPNNCGKTRFLQELYKWLIGDTTDIKIIKDIRSGRYSSFNDLLQDLEIDTKVDGANITVSSRRGGFKKVEQLLNPGGFKDIGLDVENNDPLHTTHFRQIFGNAVVGLISTEDRLTAARFTAEIRQDTNLLTAFYRGGHQIEKDISKYLYDVFKQKIRIDESDPGLLSIKVGDDFSHIPARGLEAYPLMKDYPLLESQGDGIRSFTTILLIALLSTQRYILIDEPDAFLHPPQASQLGRILVENSSEKRNIVISTHSVDLLRGIISATNDVTIVRLRRNQNKVEANVLNTKDIEEISRNPLLNSAKVIDGLFYQGVVITEGDSDRAFYERVNRGIYPADEIHFANAHNKQSIHKLIEPYKKAKVNFVAIVDFDMLRSIADIKRIIEATGCNENIDKILELREKIQNEITKCSDIERYNKLVENLNSRILEETQKPEILGITSKDQTEADNRSKKLRTDVEKEVADSKSWAHVKKHGKSALSDEGKTTFDELDAYCRACGIFIVPCGSLEGWLEGSGIPMTRNKANWITSALEWLETNDPKDVEPLNRFIRDIHEKITS